MQTPPCRCYNVPRIVTDTRCTRCGGGYARPTWLPPAPQPPKQETRK